MADQRVAVFEIKRYMVIWRQLEVRAFGGVQVRIRGLVRCSGIGASNQQDHRLDVYFLAPDSPMPAPQVDIANRRGAIFMEISDIHAFVDILRNENPSSDICAAITRSGPALPPPTNRSARATKTIARASERDACSRPSAFCTLPMPISAWPTSARPTPSAA
ncbi:MAG: hypothetical protein F4243_09550 [Chloroflexi bacterium]|nr:hypothetical protein [Chloroflexota bacterium]